MLISDYKNFIFIHIPKNAGISITQALIPHIVPRKVWKAHALLSACNIKLVKTDRFPRHIKAKDLREILGENTYSQYLSFAVVRNPWSWQVSLFNYMRKSKSHPEHKLALSFRSFDEYIHWRCSRNVTQQSDYITDLHANIIVDRVLKYETLREDFESICRELDVNAYLPHLNSSHDELGCYYSNLTKSLVEKKFAKDIEIFKYKYNQ